MTHTHISLAGRVGLICISLAVRDGVIWAQHIPVPLRVSSVWQPVQVQMRPDPRKVTPRTEALAQAEVNWIAAKKAWKLRSLPAIKIAAERTLAMMLFGNPDGVERVRPRALYDRALHVLYLSEELDPETVLGCILINARQIT